MFPMLDASVVCFQRSIATTWTDWTWGFIPWRFSTKHSLGQHIISYHTRSYDALGLCFRSRGPYYGMQRGNCIIHRNTIYNMHTICFVLQHCVYSSMRFAFLELRHCLLTGQPCVLSKFAYLLNKWCGVYMVLNCDKLWVLLLEVHVLNEFNVFPNICFPITN